LSKFRGPAYRILEKQNGRTMDAPIQKKVDSSATSFAFQGFCVLSPKQACLSPGGCQVSWPFFKALRTVATIIPHQFCTPPRLRPYREHETGAGREERVRRSPDGKTANWPRPGGGASLLQPLRLYERRYTRMRLETEAKYLTFAAFFSVPNDARVAQW
jgi:hypothetical protein